MSICKYFLIAAALPNFLLSLRVNAAEKTILEIGISRAFKSTVVKFFN